MVAIVTFKAGAWGLLLLGLVLGETYRLIWGDQRSSEPLESDTTQPTTKTHRGPPMRSYPHLDTTSLVVLAQQGDESALTVLIQRETEGLLAYASSYLRSSTAPPGDLVQKTWDKIIPALPALREPKYFRSWAIKILQRVAMRERLGSIELEEYVEDSNLDGETLFRQALRFDAVLEDYDAQRMIKWMIDHVDSETASIAVLRALGGLRWKETIEQMNLLYPESAPWSKSKCEARIKKITNTQAKSLRRLLGGREE